MTIEDFCRMADEYAKGIAPDNKEEQTAISADSLGFLNKVMEKYCLVEKSKVEQMYKEAAEGKCELEKTQPQNTYAKNSIAMRIGVNFGCVHTLKSLFPEIGKEVG